MLFIQVNPFVFINTFFASSVFLPCSLCCFCEVFAKLPMTGPCCPPTDPQALRVCLQLAWTTMNPVYSPASAGVPFANTKGLGYPGNLAPPPRHPRAAAAAGGRRDPACCAVCLQLDSRWATRRLRPTPLASTRGPTMPSPAVRREEAALGVCGV